MENLTGGDNPEAESGLSSRIGDIGTPLPHSTATISSTEALNEMERVLQGAMEPIRSRLSDEKQALKESVLKELRKYHGRQERSLSFSLADLRQYRNLLIPVARLPPEVLSQIFVFNAQLEPPEERIEAARTSSRVCKRWREIALDCPELWSHIYCGYNNPPRWLAEIVKRSRWVPLSLIGDAGVERIKETVALVANNMDRLKSINLSIPNKKRYDADSLFKAFSQPALGLQHLTIDSHYHGSTFAFPHTFLGGRAPNLRHIKLKISTFVPWKSGLFANLTTLEIDGHQKESDDRSLESLEMLLVALKKMPRLESLILHHCTPALASSSAKCVDVDLPNLERLELASFLEHGRDFLRQITINPSATLFLNLSCRNMVEGDISKFLQVFSSHPWVTPAPTGKVNFAWGCDELRISAWPVQQHSKVINSGNASTELVFRARPSSRRLPRPPVMAWACFAAFASPELRSFEISGDTIKWTAGVWTKLARMVPNLQSLAVDGPEQAVVLCKALRPPDEFDPDPANYCFPTLTYLELAVRYDHPLSTPGRAETQLSAVLPRFLAARAAAGCSTPELVFVVRPSWKFPEGWSEPFKEAVPGITVREHHLGY